MNAENQRHARHANTGADTPRESRELTDVEGRLRHMDALGVDVEVVYPTLLLKRGDRVRIELVNTLPEPTIAHWHGLAVDSTCAVYVSEVTWTFAVSRGRAPADCHTFQKFSLQS